jgi:hypothetical protein
VCRVTVTVAVKVFDGLVIATDSATTFQLSNGAAQVYNTADKIFQLHRSSPIAAATWGLGSIGDASISTLAKDLRRRLMGRDEDHADWELDATTYTIESVANRLVEMMYDELYEPLVGAQQPPQFLGFLVAGYSAQSRQAEGWVISIEGPTRPVPRQELPPLASGWVAYALPEACQRLFNGWDPTLPTKLASVVDPAVMPQVVQILNNEKRAAVPGGMPFADAVNFAKFLVDVTAGYAHFLMGPDVVGGPIDVAGITRHEGFRWIDRKHYYRPELNPEDPHP